MKRPTVVAWTCGIGLALVGGAWASTASAKREHQQTAARPFKPLAPEAPGRMFLNKAQMAEARSAGTVARPVRSLLAITAPMAFGDYVWNEKGVAPGSTWIRVDLRSQIISVFRGSDEIGTAVIVYGGDNKKTPSGALHILAKARNHRSSLYDASMPYTLRLTGDGVSIHGSSVRWGAATHGCIGVPLPFAERLFAAVRIGDEVDITPPRRTGA